MRSGATTIGVQASPPRSTSIEDIETGAFSLPCNAASKAVASAGSVASAYSAAPPPVASSVASVARQNVRHRSVSDSSRRSSFGRASGLASAGADLSVRASVAPGLGSRSSPSRVGLLHNRSAQHNACGSVNEGSPCDNGSSAAADVNRGGAAPSTAPPAWAEQVAESCNSRGAVPSAPTSVGEPASASGLSGAMRSATPGCIRTGAGTPVDIRSGSVTPGGVWSGTATPGAGRTDRLNSSNASGAITIVDAALQKSQQLLEELAGLGLWAEDHVVPDADRSNRTVPSLASSIASASPARSPGWPPSMGSVGSPASEPELRLSELGQPEDILDQWRKLLRTRSASALPSGALVDSNCSRSTSVPVKRRWGTDWGPFSSLIKENGSPPATPAKATAFEHRVRASAGTVEVPLAVVEKLWQCLCNMEALANQEDSDGSDADSALAAALAKAIGQVHDPCGEPCPSARVRLPTQLVSELCGWLGDLEAVGSGLSACGSEPGHDFGKAPTVSTTYVDSTYVASLSGASELVSFCGFPEAEAWLGSSLSESPPSSPSLASRLTVARQAVAAGGNSLAVPAAQISFSAQRVNEAASMSKAPAFSGMAAKSSTPAARCSQGRVVHCTRAPSPARSVQIPQVRTSSPCKVRTVSPVKVRPASPQQPRCSSPCRRQATPVPCPAVMPGVRCRSPRLVCRPIAVTSIYNVLSWEL